MSVAHDDVALLATLQSIAPPHIAVGLRRITAGDEQRLLADEAASLRSNDLAARRASGAARIVARELLAQRGYPGFPIRKGEGGEPIWPQGISGSLAHDESIAAAAIAEREDAGAIGIDVEPALPLPLDMFALVMTPEERRATGDDPLLARAVFAAKEAVFKASYPLDRSFLEFHDIAVDLAGGSAATRGSRTFLLRHAIGPHIFALAFLR